MVRTRFSLVVAWATFAVLVTHFQVAKADTSEAAFANTLKVQRTIELARYYLVHDKSKEAVAILEKHLAIINGNPIYLRLLRDAYRSYIKELHLHQQEALAGKYLERLSILDVEAAKDASLRPAATKPKPKANGFYTRVVKPLINPRRTRPAQPKTSPATEMPQPSTVRGKLDDDPFDLAYQRYPVPDFASKRKSEAKKLLSDADAMFRQRKFEKARQLFAAAHQRDPKAAEGSHGRWAYCRMNRVVDQLNANNSDVPSLAALEKEVKTAVEMAPNLANFGRWLLKEIDQRKKSTPGNATSKPSIAVRHRGRNTQGWNVSESANFRILHRESRDFAEQVAAVAERTRRETFRKWFGNAQAKWQSKCELYVYGTADEYSQATKIPGSCPGHCRFEMKSGELITRRMYLHRDHPRMLRAILPHETTHAVFAGQFGKHHLPRWADEGLAVLSEPLSTVSQHYRNLAYFHSNKRLFRVSDLLRMDDYPPAGQISAFYAQSLHLVAYLSKLRGPQVFVAFVRDGLDGNFESALRKHYNFASIAELEQRWGRQVDADSQRYGPSMASRN